MLAAQQGNIKFCKQLVEAGADVKYKKGGASALDYALSTREIQDAKTQIELIEYLYKQKTPVTKVTKSILIKGHRTGVYGDTPANSEYILQWGIKQGIVKMKDLSKERKIFYKISKGQEINSSILKGISVNELYNTYGEKMTSALYEAITAGDFPMVKFLIKEGANETGIKEAITDSNSYRIKKYIYQKFPNCKR